MTDGTNRGCPYCHEEIKADAVLCKHCRSAVPPERPPHGGTCPYCKEEIRPEAVKCKHCGSMVGADASVRAPGSTGCADCNGAATAQRAATAAAGLGPLGAGVGVTAAPTCGPCNGAVINGPLSNPTIQRFRTCSVRVCLPGFECRTFEWTEPCGKPGGWEVLQ